VRACHVAPLGDTRRLSRGHSPVAKPCPHRELGIEWSILAASTPSQSGSAPPAAFGSIPYKWMLVALLFLTGAFNYADRTAITAVFPLLKTSLGFDDVGLGATGSLFLWSYALASPFSGYAGDRFDRGRIIVLSLAGWSAATLLTGLAVSQWQLLIMRAVLGLLESFYLPAALALVADYHDERTMATAMGILGVGEYLGLVGGGTLGGYLGAHFGWRVPLCSLGLIGIAMAALFWFVMPRKRIQKRATAAQPRSSLSFPQAAVGLARIPSFHVLAAGGVLGSIGAWIFINWLPLYFRESFQMSLAGAGFIGSSVVSATAAISTAAAGPLSDFVARRGDHRRMLLQAAMILCAAPTLLAFIWTNNYAAIIAALVLYAIFRSIGDLNIIPLLCTLAGENKRSTALGLTNMMNTVAGGLGIFVAGFLKKDFGLAGVFAGVAGILAFDAALIFAGYALFLKNDLRRATDRAE
jgi:MFS family permease